MHSNMSINACICLPLSCSCAARVKNVTEICLSCIVLILSPSIALHLWLSLSDLHIQVDMYHLVFMPRCFFLMWIPELNPTPTHRAERCSLLSSEGVTKFMLEHGTKVKYWKYWDESEPKKKKKETGRFVVFHSKHLFPSCGEYKPAELHVCDVGIYLPDWSQLPPPVWYSPSFSVGSSRLSIVSLLHCSLSHLHLALHISQSSPPHFFHSICIFNSFFLTFSINLSLCSYLSFSICFPSAHSLSLF